MQFISALDSHPAIAALGERLQAELRTGKQVLWLLSGGSNIQASVTIMRELAPDLTANLTIILGDERYGEVGHIDSNDVQLLGAGFDPKQATLIQVLQAGMSFTATRDNYELSALQAFTDADIIIGQFGIGSDGHIAGILPASPAVTSLAFVAAYTHPPYERLTLTGHALRRVTAAYVLAFGADKQVALNALETKSLTYSEQPSQILKELPEAYVFSDQIGHRHGA